MKQRPPLHQRIAPLLAMLALLGPAVLIAQDDDALLRNAKLLYYSGRLAEAVGHFQASLRAHPAWGMAHYNLALNFWHLRDYAQALRHARDARALGMPQAAGIEQTLTGRRRS